MVNYGLQYCFCKPLHVALQLASCDHKWFHIHFTIILLHSRPQHLTGLKLIADVCNGQLEGGNVGSTDITFHPNFVASGTYTADTKTAGWGKSVQIPLTWLDGERDGSSSVLISLNQQEYLSSSTTRSAHCKLWRWHHLSNFQGWHWYWHGTSSGSLYSGAFNIHMHWNIWGCPKRANTPENCTSVCVFLIFHIYWASCSLLHRSICLLLQAALPCLLFSKGHTKLRLFGGTNADMAPQIDYLTWVRTYYQFVADNFCLKISNWYSMISIGFSTNCCQNGSSI